MKTVWALFHFKDFYKSHSADMRDHYPEKPSVEDLLGKGFTAWEARQMLKGNSVERGNSSFYLEEIDDYEGDT